MSRSCRLAAVFVICCLTPLWAQDTAPGVALKKLQDGNERFVAEKPSERDVSGKRRQDLAKGQKPFAVVLTCADSRVAPELLFDQGLGDLFVIRVAGNLTDVFVLGSIEYAVEHLHTPLVVVLGHENCGAVDAVLKGGEAHGNLEKLLKSVHVGKERPKDPAAALATAVKANVRHQTNLLTEKSKVLKEAVTKKHVQIVSGVYSLGSGKVEWLKAPEKK